MYLPRSSTVFSITLLALFLCSGDAHKEQPESNNLRGGSSTSKTSSWLRRFLQPFGDEFVFGGPGPDYAFDTSCETNCIAATSNSCKDVKTPDFCRPPIKAKGDDITVRNDPCFKPGFRFIPNKDMLKDPGNFGPYKDLDLTDLSVKCYWFEDHLCSAFSTTGYMKMNVVLSDLDDYESDSSDEDEDEDENALAVCLGLYVRDDVEEE